MNCTNCIENYINGNLSDAKRLAKRLSRPALRDALQTEYGKGLKEAVLIVDFLKDGGSFQAACDAQYGKGEA